MTFNPFSCKHTAPQQSSNVVASPNAPTFFWPFVYRMVIFQCWNHITTKLCLCNMSCLAEMQSLWKHKMIWSVKAFDKAVKVERHDQIFQRRWCERHRVRWSAAAPQSVCAWGDIFSNSAASCSNPHRGLAFKKRGQNSRWTNVVVNNTYSFLNFHRVKSKNAVNIKYLYLRDHNIPNTPNYYQTPLCSQNYTYTEKPVWLVMFDLPLLTLSACF